MRSVAFALLALALASPLAASDQVESFRWPLRDTAFTPQLACIFVFDTPGTERCDAFSDLNLAGNLRVVVQGPGRAVALLDDVSTTGVAREIARADCTTRCEQSFPMTSATLGRLHVDGTGVPGTTIYVSVESTMERVLIELGLDHLLA